MTEAGEHDCIVMARAMTERGTRFSMETSSRRELRRLKKAAILADYDATEMIGRKFNKYVQSFPMRERDQYFCCFYCGEELNFHNKSNDHIYPQSRGGVITVPACLPCNRRKRNDLLDVFRAQWFGKKFIFWGEGFIARCEQRDRERQEEV